MQKNDRREMAFSDKVEARCRALTREIRPP